MNFQCARKFFRDNFEADDASSGFPCDDLAESKEQRWRDYVIGLFRTSQITEKQRDEWISGNPFSN